MFDLQAAGYVGLIRQVRRRSLPGREETPVQGSDVAGGSLLKTAQLMRDAVNGSGGQGAKEMDRALKPFLTTFISSL